MTVTETPTLPTRQFKMALLHDEFLSDISGNSGRYSKGDVLRVDEATAQRWYERGIAEIADPDAPTAGELQRRVKRDEFLRRAVPVEGVFDQMVTRDMAGGGSQRAARPSGQDAPRDSTYMPTMPMPSTRRGRPRKADLEGADILDTGDEE